MHNISRMKVVQATSNVYELKADTVVMIGIIDDYC